MKSYILVWFLICGLIVCPCVIPAATYRVKPDGTGDFPTIQAAVNAADHGDIIQVEDGTYTGTGNRDIDFKGKAITVRGNIADPNLVVIDCQGTEAQPHRGFHFICGEDPNSILEGFTITNGYGFSIDLYGNGVFYSVGGGIYCKDSHPTIENTIINGNMADQGGGIFNASNSTIQDCIISHNHSNFQGAGIYNYLSSSMIQNCFINNNISSDTGGGIFNHDGSTKINNCMIKNNTALSGGGGISNGGTSTSTIENCVIIENTAISGGGINAAGGRPKILTCTISYNTAENGGGIYRCLEYVKDCTISYNSATNGGGISRANVDRCKIIGNYATNSGGGLYDCTYVLNSIISDNTAEFFGGGLYDCDGNIRHCTIVKNEAGALGNGLYDCNGNISHCIIFYNPETGNMDQIHHACSAPNYSCLEWWGGGGTGNIDAYPLFVDFNAGNYHLSSNSPCLDSGDPEYSSINQKDIDGDPRVMSRVDIGADEISCADAPFILPRSTKIYFTVYGTDINPSKRLYFSNYGLPMLNWSILSNCEWLEANPTEGVLEFEKTGNTTLVMKNYERMNYGSYDGEVRIIDPNAINSPQIVEILFQYYPSFSISPAFFNFDCDIKKPELLSDTLTIQNIGYGTLNWRIAEPVDCNWLSINPLAGQCISEKDYANIIVNTTGLDEGLYEYNLTISDANSSAPSLTVPISLKIYQVRQRHVPTEYSTIQAAIDAAFDGDHVIIHPGIYNEDFIQLQGKQITVRSMDPANPEFVDRTILSSGESGFGTFFALESDQDYSHAVIEGLTVANAAQFYYGYPSIFRGIVISTDSYDQGPLRNGPLVRNCVFRNLTADRVVFLRNVSMEFENCAFENNSIFGSLIESSSSEEGLLRLKNCLIANNHILNVFYYPNPYVYLYCIRVSKISLEIDHCTIAHNRSWSQPPFFTYFPGIYSNNGSISITNSILWENTDLSENDSYRQIVSVLPETTPSETYISISTSDIQHGMDSVLVFPSSTFSAYLNTRQLPDPNLIDPNWVEWGPGNLDVNPLFVREPNDGGDGWLAIELNPQEWDYSPLYNNDYGDLHLKSETGRYRWDGYFQGDFNMDKSVNFTDFAFFAKDWGKDTAFGHFDERNNFIEDRYIDMADLEVLCGEWLCQRVFGVWMTDSVSSPCIDAGDPNDMGWQNELWPHGGRINMGAYGGTAEASMSPNPMGNAADLDHDDSVDLADWSLWADDWLLKKVLMDADFDRDNDTDLDDLVIFAGQWCWVETE